MKIEKLTRVQVLNFRNVICIRKCKENLAVCIYCTRKICISNCVSKTNLQPHPLIVKNS